MNASLWCASWMGGGHLSVAPVVVCPAAGGGHGGAARYWRPGRSLGFAARSLRVRVPLFRCSGGKRYPLIVVLALSRRGRGYHNVCIVPHGTMEHSTYRPLPCCLEALGPKGLRDSRGCCRRALFGRNLAATAAQQRGVRPGSHRWVLQPTDKLRACLGAWALIRGELPTPMQQPLNTLMNRAG